jgi:hypothetical protein
MTAAILSLLTPGSLGMPVNDILSYQEKIISHPLIS